MPWSKSNNVEHILEMVRTISQNRQRKIKVLDAGSGGGKWGFLIRGFLDMEVNGPWPERWEHTIEALEVYPAYITENLAYPYIYDQVHNDDFRLFFRGAAQSVIMESMPKYDLVIMGDCLEHVDKVDGKEAIANVKRFANNLIVSVPGYRDKQGPKFGNEAERHLAFWEPEEFDQLGATKVQRTGDLITAHWAWE